MVQELQGLHAAVQAQASLPLILENLGCSCMMLDDLGLSWIILGDLRCSAQSVAQPPAVPVGVGPGVIIEEDEEALEGGAHPPLWQKWGSDSPKARGMRLGLAS